MSTRFIAEEFPKQSSITRHPLLRKGTLAHRVDTEYQHPLLRVMSKRRNMEAIRHGEISCGYKCRSH